MSIVEKFLLDFRNALSYNPRINYFHSEKIGFSIRLQDYNEVSDRVLGYLSSVIGDGFQFVGVYLSGYLWLPCILLTIWKTGNACACMGSQYPDEYNNRFLMSLRVKFIISTHEKLFCEAGLVGTFKINDQQFHVWQRNTVSLSPTECPYSDICYAIMTSGSTGIPKTVKVPWSCILPNVHEFIKICDIIGCTLTIVSLSAKLCSQSLLNILFKNSKYIFESTLEKQNETHFECYISEVGNSRITVLQMTPSIFKRWGYDNIKNIILSHNSPLRILLLGGEKFPVEILKYKCLDNETRIYNVYGITEISCWAFMSDCLDHSCKDIPLGAPLDDILYKTDSDGHLYIGSKTRKCIVDDEVICENDDILYRKSGDIVTVKDNKIYYVSRTNQQVKKFGITINLEEIEKVFLNDNKQHDECYCVFDEDTMKVALFYVNNELEAEYHVNSGNNAQASSSCKNVLSMSGMEVPNDIIEIKSAPLNSNGKCDRKSLLDIYKKILKLRVLSDLDIKCILKEVWNSIVGSGNFLFLGGDSVKALQLITRLDDQGVRVPKDFLTTLLSVGDYENCLKCLLDSNKSLDAPFNKKIKMSLEDNVQNMFILWTFDMKKCIDATPAIYKHNGESNVVVGSHSTILASIVVKTGHENWKIFLGDRIESGVSIDETSMSGVVGCYDHYLYCISMYDGCIIWKYKTEGMIKSTPCFSTDKSHVYAASYDTHLYCLSSRDGALIKKIKLSDNGVFSSVLRSDEMSTLYVATLNGTCASLDQRTNEIIWKRRLKSPIFASPVLIPRDNQLDACVIFAQVRGFLECLSSKTGVQLWRYETEGNIYSTPVYIASLEALLFACYDSHLYCLKCETEPLLIWKVQTDSPTFARPCLFSLSGDSKEAAVVANTKGQLNVYSVESGSSIASTSLPGEVFSSPKVVNQNVVVGCRDNNLYCLKIGFFPTEHSGEREAYSETKPTKLLKKEYS